ncbi:MAG TPA: polyamine aminopropyltransferase [Pyrodictium sp.]|nr:polyamine aminopropyltransferase [Pyrodictium sp.]
MLSIYKVKDVIVKRKSKFQEIVVVVVEGYGKALILDNLIQSTEFDEHIYHESLVHPAMVTHPNPQRVLVLGGGEGATLREVLKHSCVSEAVMVDIDEEVVNVAREYLPEWHQGSFDDPRSRIVIADGAKYVEEMYRRGEKFDVIIMDLTDPFGSDVAKHLYTKSFMEKISGILSDDGIMVTQARCSYLYQQAYMDVVKAIAAVFPVVVEYAEFIPSFAYPNNYVIGSKKHDPRALSEEEVNRRLEERSVKTRFYSGAVHVALMKHPVLL